MHTAAFKAQHGRLLARASGAGALAAAHCCGCFFCRPTTKRSSMVVQCKGGCINQHTKAQLRKTHNPHTEAPNSNPQALRPWLTGFWCQRSRCWGQNDRAGEDGRAEKEVDKGRQGGVEKPGNPSPPTNTTRVKKTGVHWAFFGTGFRCQTRDGLKQ